MTVFRIVPSEDYKVLIEYLSDPGVVLLPESVLAEFTPDIQRKFRQMNENVEVDYDFGGEPDVYVDIISGDHCYAYKTLVGEEDDDSEDLS